MPEPEPASYRLHHVYSACIVFEWNPKRWPEEGIKMMCRLRLTPGVEVWAMRAPFAYSNATWTLLNITNAMLRHFFTKGFLPPAPSWVCIPVDNGTLCRAPQLAGMLTGVYWGGDCPYGVNNCGDHIRLDIFPTGPWGVPLVGDFFARQVKDAFIVALAYGEAWKRLILAGILVLGVFEAMGFLFGFPTPARLLYSVASDILSQLGYWMGFRIGLKARLGRRFLQPIRARLTRISKLIVSKLPHVPRPRLGFPSREWLRDPRRWLWERVVWRWREEKIRQIEERLSKASSGVKEDWQIRMEQKRQWRQQARETLKRIYHALQAHDVVEFLRRISPKIDAFVSQLEAKLAERHPLLYKWYVLTYRGQYGYLYLLAEPIIRRWEAEGKITRAEADQLRKIRAALWAAVAEARARAVEAEKGVDARHLRDVFEYREKVVREALKQLDLMPHAKTKEELAKHLGSAAAHLQHIDTAGTSRLWTALGIAAEGRPVDFSTTREVVEFLWERRERLDVIVQRAKELIAQHYAHAPLSIKDIAKEEVSRQVAKVKPLFEAVAKARRYAATGEGVEEVVQALKSKEVKRAAKAAEVEIGALRKAAERAYKLEEERKELTSKIEELRKRAEAIRAEVDALRQSGASKELGEKQRQLEEVYVEIEKLQQRLSRVEERLVESKRMLAVEAREALEKAARSYKGVFEGVKYETDPVYVELRRALIEGRLEEAYRQLRERYEREGRDVRRVDRVYLQLKPFEERLQKAREELRAAVREHEAVVRAEAVRRADAVTYLESLFKTLHAAAEEDVKRGVELARELGLEKTAQYLEEYLRQSSVRERYSRAASEAAEALRKLAGMREYVVKEQQAAEEKLRQVTKAEDALRRIGQTTEFGQAAKAAKEAGLEKTAQFLERWAGLVRQAEERGGLEVVNRLGRALASGRLAEEASAMAAEGKPLGEWYGRVLELKPLYEEAVKEATKAKAEAEAVVKTATELKTLIEKTRADSPVDLITRASRLDAEELQKAAEAARRVGLEHTAKYFEELARYAASAKEGAKAVAEYVMVEKRLSALEAKARAELYRAEKVAEGLIALLGGREYEKLAYVRAAAKELEGLGRDLSALESTLGKALEKTPEELQKAAEKARQMGLEPAAKAFESAASLQRALQEAREELPALKERLGEKFAEVLKEPSLLRHSVDELKAMAESAKAVGLEKTARALEEAVRAASEVQAAYKAVDEKKAALESLKAAVKKLAEARREVELLRHHYTYEVGAPVWRELRQRGVDTLLLRAPLTAYITATLESTLLREAAEAFRPSFMKYEREAATTVVYLPVSESNKLGPAVSWERAIKGEFRPYVEEIADVKAPTLKQAVKEYYAGRGRQFKELAYLEARAAEAVLDVHASKFFLEKYAKEGKQEDLALAIALAYRAAKAYQRYQHSDLGPLAEAVAEIRRVLNLTGRDVTTEALAKAVEQLGGEKALKEALKPKTVEEAVKWLREAWASVDYRTLESKLGLTRTYAIPEAEKALEYTAKALTPSRIAALTEGKVAEEAFSVMRAYSLLREFERFMRERPKEVAAKAEPTVLRSLDKPLPSLQASAVDKVAKEAAAKLIKEAEALAQQHGLKHPEALAMLEQIRELVRVSPEAFGELVHAASAARGPFKEWARQLVAEVRKNWDVYREGWEAPVVQRLEALKKVPAATEAPSPIPREFVALALWAELNQVKELRQIVKEISPAAVEEASLIAEAVKAIQRDLEKLKTVDLERPVFVSFETLEKKTVRGIERLVVDEAAELSKASRYLQHQDPRVREEAELLLKFARGEITRTQLREELGKRGGPLTEEGREAVTIEQRLKDMEAVLKAKLAKESGILWHVEAMRREFTRIAYRAAVRAGLGDSDAEAELRVLAALSPHASTAVKYAESLKLLRALTEGLDKAVYEPELAKKFPELRDVLLERDRVLKKTEELEKTGDPEKLVVAGVLREFAEGRISRSQLLDVAKEKRVDLSEFSVVVVERARRDVIHEVRRLAGSAAVSSLEAPEGLVNLGVWAELTGKTWLTQLLQELSPKAAEEARARAEALKTMMEELRMLNSLDLERPVRIELKSLSVRDKPLLVDEYQELSRVENYVKNWRPDVREEVDLILKFLRGEITRSQLRERLSGRELTTPEGIAALSMERRIAELRAKLTEELAREVSQLGGLWKAAAVMSALTRGADKVVYEPRLAELFPELKEVFLEKERALRRAEELEKAGRVDAAKALREFAEGRLTRSQLVEAVEDRGLVHEFSPDFFRSIARAAVVRSALSREDLAELLGAKSLREALEARLPMDLYAELANELRVKLEEAAAKAGIPQSYAKYGVLQGAARYVEELTKLVTQLPVDIQAAYAALGAVKHELLSIDELKLLGELANGNYATVERLRKKLQEAEAEVAKAVFNAIRELGVRRVPPELLEIAARVELTPEELRMLLAELEAAKATERDKAFAWPEFAEYLPLIFTTTDEKAAKAWRRGGGLVIEATVFVGDKPKRVYILAPKNAPVEDIREALYAIRGVEIVGQPKWMAGWDVAEALGFVVERTEKGIALKPKVEQFIDLEKPLPYWKEVWEALKLTRPDLVREAVGAGWSIVHWEDGLAAVNAYLFLKRAQRWDAFEPADIERVLEEYRRRYSPTFERYVKAMSVEKLGFDVVDFLKGAYAVMRRQRGEYATYKPYDPEAYARLIWWAKKVGRYASLYELLQPDFRQTVTLKALNIAIKSGWITYSEALDLFNSWRRNNDVAKWDEEALKIALRGNLRMKETEEAIKRFIDSIKTSRQVEAEEAARERLRLMEEQRRREEEMKKIRGIKERPRAKPAETQQEAKKEEVEQVKKEEAQPKAEEKAQPEEAKQVKKEEAQPEEAKAAKAEAKPPEAKRPEEAEKPAEEKPSEEVSYVKFGYVHVKSTHMNNAVVRAFAVEHPENWHLKLTPEAYIELRAGLAPFELEKLEDARERAATKRRALALLSERYGSIAVPEEVRKKAERKAAAEFEKWAARLASRHDPEAVEAVVNRLKALVAQWVERASVPNAYDFIAVAMWTWEGDPKTRTVDEEWGYWLFKEDFKVVKELADRYGIEVLKLWNAYRSAVDKYLQVVTSYGDVVKRAVVPIDVALRTSLVAAGGVAIAEALHGVVRPELVGAATMAASLAMAGKYRDAVHVIKTAVERVKVTVEKAFQGVKIAVEKLYEAVVEAAARILQLLREHWRAVALVAAAAAAGLITWVVAQQLDFTLWQEHAASLASAGFFPVVWPAEDKQRQLWKKTLNDWSLSAAGEKVEVIKAILSDKPVTAERFEQTESSAAREAGLRAWLIKRALELRWEPTAEKAVATLVEEAVGPRLDKERLKAFGVAQGVVGFLYKLRGEKESALSVGNVEARELYAIVAKTGQKTIRVEVLAREVKGGDFKAVDTPIGRLYRLASLSVSTEPNGDPGTPKLNFTASVEREYRVGVALAGERIEERRRAGLYGFMLTDLGLHGLKSPDASEHAFLGLFAQLKRMYIDDANLTDTGLSLQIVSEVEERFPPKVFFWETMRGAVERALEKALGPQRPEDLNQVLEALCGGPCVDERGRPSAEPLLKILREYFAELKELTAVVRTKEWRFFVRDDVNEVIINKNKGVVYVPRRVLFELLEAMEWPEFWATLIEGDGMPKVDQQRLGLAVGKGYEAIAALLMATLALRYGIQPRLIEGEGAIFLNAESSRIAMLLLMHELKKVSVRTLEQNELAKKAAPWGLAGAMALIVRRLVEAGMPGGRDPPKLISLLAFYERALADLYAIYEKVKAGKAERPWYFDLVEKILKEEGDTPFYVREKILPTTAFDLRKKYIDREFKLAVEETWKRYKPVMALVDRSYVLSAEYGEKKGSAVIMVPVDTADGVRWQEVKVWTDWRNYQMFCSGQHCDEARKALGAEEREGGYYIKSVLGKAIIYTALRRLENSLEIGEWSEGVKRQMEKREEGVETWMKAPARVELLEVRENGDIRFRIWFYRWLETRPHKPYVDVLVEYDEARRSFRGWLYANEYEGIYREDLAKLKELFEKEGLPVTAKWDGDEVEGLYFSGGFRKALLKRLGYSPEEAPAAEPASMKCLSGLRFEVEGRMVEFEKTESKRTSLAALVQFHTKEEAEEFYKRLKVAGVYADVKGREVRLNDESYWGMVITSGVVPEGWQLVYPLEGDQYRDLYVYKRVIRQEDKVDVYYQFVVKVGDMWRAVGGWYDEKRQTIILYHSDRAVLETLREAVKRAVGVELGEIGKHSGVYQLVITRPVLEKFEKRAPAAAVGEAVVHVDGDFIVIKHGGIEHRVEFELVQAREGVLVDSSLRPALEVLGVPFEWTPKGLKLGRDGMWGLLAAALEEVLNRKEQPKEEEVLKQLKLPKGVSIIRARPKRGHYIFRVDAEDGQYVYSVLRVGKEWTAMGGKVTEYGSVLMSHSEEKVARAHAEAHNELLAQCIEEGRCTPKEPRQKPKSKTWYFHLNKTELEELEG